MMKSQNTLETGKNNHGKDVAFGAPKERRTLAFDTDKTSVSYTKAMPVVPGWRGVRQSPQAALPLFADQGEALREVEHLARGRGAITNRSGRFEHFEEAGFDDGWADGAYSAEEGVKLRTRVIEEFAKTIITRNVSPDIPFDRSINAYRGCEHGCFYFFSRPTHTYMGHSAGLDFETQLYAKPNAADVLRAELNKPGYKVAPIALGTNTDPYQPIEREREITRSILKVLYEARHPVTIVTKSRLVVRDLDLLSPMAEAGLVKVTLSVTTLDPKLAGAMEPRASSPQRRLDAIRLLSDAGVPAGVFVAPIIPAVNDHELERVLEAAAHAGAREAGYILVRLPLEIRDLFAEWLDVHMPDRKDRVLARLRVLRGGSGRLNDPRFGHRMRGQGPEADLLSQRFKRMVRKLSLNAMRGEQGEHGSLRCDQFRPPALDERQLQLF